MCYGVHTSREPHFVQLSVHYGEVLESGKDGFQLSLHWKVSCGESSVAGAVKAMLLDFNCK